LHASVFCIVADSDEYDEQIAAECVGDSLADRKVEADVVNARKQSQEVHLNAVDRLYGLEELFAGRYYGVV
jgi:hypothetical protein